MNRSEFIPSKHRQTGAVLILSLIILSVLTMVAVTGMNTSITEEKMSGNIRDQEFAMQASESAMRDATNAIDLFVSFGNLTGTNGLLGLTDNEIYYLSDTAWGVGANATDAPALASGQLAATPRRIVKYIGDEDFCTPAAAKGLNELGAGTSFACPSSIFRVTAHGTGLSPNTTKVTQSYFARDAL